MFLCVDFWFSIWQAHERTDWPLLYVGLLLLHASLVYVIAKVITPVAATDTPIDMTAFFDKNRPKFMILLLAMLALNQVTNWTLPGFHSVIMIFLSATWALVFSVGLIFKSHTVQLIVVAANITLTIYYAVKFIPAL